MTYLIKVKHYYQDRDNPKIQTIRDAGEYFMRYALFMALIKTGSDFEIVSEDSDRGTF